MIAEPYTDIHFIDSLTGWKVNGDVKKTSDGGLNWQVQMLPIGGIVTLINMNTFSIINRDTLWGVGGQAFIGALRRKGIIYKTTNGGNNWGYQLPDTNIIKNKVYYFSNFVNKFVGWSYLSSAGIHTIVGGEDTTFYTGVNNNITSISTEFILYQNYPNPFNSVSSIKYQVLRSADIKLIVYNIIGKEITILINKKQNSGTYEVKFDGSNQSSGIYFYILFVDGVRIDTKKMALVK
ncbi:MAG: T9SS type A sorting domain-containing protein [Ignavibacteriae bacterium]|nr:T9SS type A sorting domain-containing protein [Ignavibacteriota bacterium]